MSANLHHASSSVSCTWNGPNPGLRDSEFGADAAGTAVICDAAPRQSRAEPRPHRDIIMCDWRPWWDVAGVFAGTGQTGTRFRCPAGFAALSIKLLTAPGAVTEDAENSVVFLYSKLQLRTALGASPEPRQPK